MLIESDKIFLRDSGWDQASVNATSRASANKVEHMGILGSRLLFGMLNALDVSTVVLC